MKSCVLLAAHKTEILHSLPIVLRKAGHHVLIAVSGLDVLNKARRSLPSVIILDSALLDIDGNTVCEILSRLPSTADIPRILLATQTIFPSVAPAVRSPLNDAAAPPFNSEEIVRRVNQVLGPNWQQPEEMSGHKAELLSTSSESWAGREVVSAID